MVWTVPYCFYRLIICYFSGRRKFWLIEDFEGESSLLTMVIFCLFGLLVESEVLLLVRDNLDGDRCFWTFFAGEMVGYGWKLEGLGGFLLKLIRIFWLLISDFLRSLISLACSMMILLIL
jgi:hypothetical protein